MIRNRPFDDTRNDFEKMWRFLQQDYAQKQDRFIIHVQVRPMELPWPPLLHGVNLRQVASQEAG